MSKYILGIDQSTQGTKAMLFDESGRIVIRKDLAHEQIIDERGWVEHNPNEILDNVYALIKTLKGELKAADKLVGLGISNQRETAMAWNKKTGEPVYNAIVWQCARGAAICEGISDKAKAVQEKTGLQLSPYFSAAKLAWILQNVDGVKELAESGDLCCGTMDSWLIYKLSKDNAFKTDYSNASRTQLFNISTLSWDEDICNWFGIPVKCLAEVCDSNALYGYTDFNGILDEEIPIHGVMGDSHGALYGQGCLVSGTAKVTYGTGSSVMMNVGDKPIFSDKGIVSSLAWSMDGKAEYVLEGNINYTGAVITWLQKDLKLIESAKETAELAFNANKADKTYLVPAFTGLGAPYWDSEATASIVGMTRTTGKNEIVKAALDCIAYQITDIVKLMHEESGIKLQEIRVDGGPTKNNYLMQFQSDALQIPVQVPDAEEFSAMGPAFAAGIALGHYSKDTIFGCVERNAYEPKKDVAVADEEYAGWKNAVSKVLTK